MKAKLTHWAFWAAILTACFFLSGCATNLEGKSAAYKFVHEKTFWASLEGGGSDAAAWANLKAHEEAERMVGK